MSGSVFTEFSEEGYPSNQFKFNTHRKKLNLECLEHVDIDQVVSQNDIAVLQKYLKTTACCNLDRERCHMCMTPVDANLLKLFRLAQLSLEWYQYCQESLIYYFNQFKEKHDKLKVEVTKLKVQMQNTTPAIFPYDPYDVRRVVCFKHLYKLLMLQLYKV